VVQQRGEQLDARVVDGGACQPPMSDEGIASASGQEASNHARNLPGTFLEAAHLENAAFGGATTEPPKGRMTRPAPAGDDATPAKP